VPEVLRLAAFTDDPAGGNPAGVVLDAGGLDAAAMQRIAAEVGFSETAFVDGDAVRFFSPVAEVPFCGHATIATGVALGDGTHVLRTAAGEVPVVVRDGVATLTSVAPSLHRVREDELAEALELLRWWPEDLDPALPPRIAYAGARHLVLAAATRERLDELDYEFDGLRAFMEDRDLITVDLVHREDPTTFQARNPFPVGGVVEDPATGAAAAAFGGYLRSLRLVEPPVRVTIRQGEAMGRPSTILVDIPAEGSIAVSGRAVPMP
jgi:PhzF family phenazine biosynthesis protein